MNNWKIMPIDCCWMSRSDLAILFEQDNSEVGSNLGEPSIRWTQTSAFFPLCPNRLYYWTFCSLESRAWPGSNESGALLLTFCPPRRVVTSRGRSFWPGLGLAAGRQKGSFCLRRNWFVQFNRSREWRKL